MEPSQVLAIGECGTQAHADFSILSTNSRAFTVEAYSFDKTSTMTFEPWRLAACTLALPAALATAGESATTGSAKPAEAAGQTLSRSGTQASVAGPADFFTGRSRIDPLWPAGKEINASGGLVTFEPGARSAWHTHPAGQYLVVTAGVGRTQEEGKAVQEIRAGDVVWCPPGVRHWHGAGPTTAMTHLAVTGTVDGKNVNWMEKVSDAQYHGH
ncbi:(R)-mandelonitrile lyase [Pigmentiphaga litoralis]|uniref:(R)-mandelonitrile lyase n=1 Tax=Pigmentiphaga litoralis TaxID=516702 RepID=UPI003B43669D